MKSTILVWPAWNNGQHRSSGAGYGVKVPIENRAAYFDPSWEAVTVILPVGDGTREVRVNVAKASFWTHSCRELISAEIGKWLIELQQVQATLPGSVGFSQAEDKREIIRRLGTSATQFYRLLDQTNYRKSLDQPLSLLQALDCDVDFVVHTKSA